MSDYIKMLEGSNVLNFNDNDIKITKVIASEHKKSFKVFFTLKNTLTYKEYKDFIEVNVNFFKKKGFTLFVDIKYKNFILTEEQVLKYYNKALNEVSLQYPSMKYFKAFKVVINNNNINMLVDNIDDHINNIKYVKEEIERFNLDLNLSLQQSNEVISLKQMQEEVDKVEDEKRVKEKEERLIDVADKKNMESQNSKKYKNYNKLQYTAISIKDIPNSRDSLSDYSLNEDLPNFMVNGEVFFTEVRKMKTNHLLTLKIYDETDSIVVKKWVRSEEEINDLNKITPGDLLQVSGKAEFDTFAQNVVLMASKIDYIGKKDTKKIQDTALVKRVELHTHTMMSNVDAVSTGKDYIDFAKDLGHKAVAITDHNGVYSFAKVHSHTKSMEDFKPIYGVELNYIDETTDFNIALTTDDISLANANYVVFDIETTGLSQEYDRLIEIAAVKVSKEGVKESFSSFINPKMPISDKITQITKITQDMVSDAPTIDEILPKFLEFCDGCILVAHNARFDIGMIYANMKRLNIALKQYPTIDTLNAIRAMYNDKTKKFNLKAMAKLFKVKQEHHHRAIDDTRVTAECFLYILQDIAKAGIKNYNEINSLIPEDMFKYVIPSHINILAKTQLGYKNMFQLLSESLTNYCYNNPRLLKKVLNEFRGGILVGSGCVNNKVFQYAMYRSMDELKEEIKYYDYIEVQPPLAYRHLFGDVTGGLDAVKEVIEKIIKIAKELGKIVVATGDVHYLHKDMKKYRDILISSKLGGNLHPLAFYDTAPDVHFRTTDQMLAEFDFLDKDLAYEIVVTNTNLIADSIEKIQAFPKKMFAPNDDEFKDSLNIPSIAQEVRNIVDKTVKKIYGSNPHEIVTKRINRELTSIIENGFASVYFMSHLLVNKSLSEGYLVGSRGSVGSSLVATMMSITEINPLSPHYRCKKCCFSVFKMNEEEKSMYHDSLSQQQQEFTKALDKVESGYDLPDAYCPDCGNALTKDGHDIPFETFLGFNGDKVPDIDLNFSGEYQAKAHEYVRELLGSEKAFRGGTVGTIAEKNAFGYVRAYDEQKNLGLRNVEIERIAAKLVGAKRSTGQHPGGIIVLPYDIDIYEVTPIQYPADNTESAWRTTHFDYHAFEDNLLKLDILGHDDPTMIRFMMDYVNENPSDFSFSTAEDIPIDDKEVYKLFSSTQVIGVTENQIDSKVASYAVPEFGTPFVRQMLKDTLPKTFAELVKISGLSHGTDVWLNNAESLVNNKTEFDKIEFSEVIGCRDDIMVYLMYQGVEPIKAFEIMEFVRRGLPSKKADVWEEHKTYLRSKGIKEWYIWSCEQIKYMFPKAHATAYVLMAIRIAWFKVHAPIIFYSAYFSKRSKAHNAKVFSLGYSGIKKEIDNLNKRKENKRDFTAKDEDLLVSLYVALEMTARGLLFLPIDIEKSEATVYKIEEGKLRIPFAAYDGLGESVAYDIVSKREEKPFTSIKDVTKRTKLNKSLTEAFEDIYAFGTLPLEENDNDQIGIFALD